MVAGFFFLLRKNLLLHRYTNSQILQLTPHIFLIKMEAKNIGYSSSFLKAQIDKTKSTIKRVKEISSKVRHQNLERVNKVACFEVQIKHTNQITLELGSDYWAELTAQQALKVLQIRLQYYTQKLAKIQAAKSKASEKAKQAEKLGKQKVVKLQDGKLGMLEVIGSENGEDIFNIVQMQQEEEEPFQQKPKESKQAEDSLATTKEQKIAQKEMDIEQDGSQQHQELQNYQQFKDDDEQWDEGANDLLQEIMTRKKASEQQEQQQKHNLPAIQEVPFSKKPTRTVTYEQTTKIDNDQNQKRKDQTKKASEVKAKQAKEEVLPAKISKFKLQKMKERLLKQIQE